MLIWVSGLASGVPGSGEIVGAGGAARTVAVRARARVPTGAWLRVARAGAAASPVAAAAVAPNAPSPAKMRSRILRLRDIVSDSTTQVT
jgi:hypothetical protein